MNNSLIIACAAGISGGHIIPCLTLVQKLEQKLNQSTQIIFFSADTPLDHHLLANNQAITAHKPLSFGSKKYSLFTLPRALWEFAKSLWQSIQILYIKRPTKLITTGGAPALAPCIAAWALSIPIELHELNAVPGRANKLLAYLSHKIVVCFEHAKQFFPSDRCVCKPYPVRFIPQSPILPKDSHRTTILVLGGSQGSQSINRLIRIWAEQMPLSIKKQITLIHQIGNSDQFDYENYYRNNGIDAITFPFCNNIEPYYHQADVIICRAGAGTLFEALALNKQCIVIPLETSYTNHQLNNAQAFAQEYPHLIQVIRQCDAEKNPHHFFDLITQKVATPQAPSLLT